MPRDCESAPARGYSREAKSSGQGYGPGLPAVGAPCLVLLRGQGKPRPTGADPEEPFAMVYSSIEIVPENSFEKPHRRPGTVLIDRKRVGNVFSKRTRTFWVDPGDHRVAVLVGAGPGGEVSASVTVREGERVELAFGIRPDWPRPRFIQGFCIAYAASVNLSSLIGWLLFPTLREIFARWSLGNPSPGTLHALLAFVLSERLFTAVAVMALWILSTWFFFSFVVSRWSRNWGIRFGSPYYLVEKVGGPTRAPEPHEDPAPAPDGDRP
jgi:hypothetical protein